ncbi:hypothetical protein C922_04835 [Plasmodium inui San Antonio 1]|uniref:MIF4G domain-containing protein n=1 Tax=Plasmodium inui San Antonio 1 TaxID=1237626 RepID=W7A6T6_9APIC|nr:hypothetical protein C922_04835 [Plasmodium inui San Antonio 1]EUD64799.1 hypothetical protein C922_04835 [Plasmodium inui San Antonio 1]
MEEIELHIIKNEIIKIGDKLIDSDDIFHLCKRIQRSRITQCIEAILECIFYMPVKIGIYATILGIITKDDEKLKLHLFLKLNHNIEVFIKKNFLHCLLWIRCIIALSCCHVFPFSQCLNLFKNLYQLCIELYKEKEFIKGDNILYLFLSNFFYISKQIYDENKEDLDNMLTICFDLIEKRQEHIDNIDLDNNDVATIEYIYIYINSVIHSDSFYDRLFYLKSALYNYVQNNLKSVATHRFYQKEIFQDIFLKKEGLEDGLSGEEQESDIHRVVLLENGDHAVDGGVCDGMNGGVDHASQNDVSNSSKDTSVGASLQNYKKKEITLPMAIEKCTNAEFFANYECVQSIFSLQIKFQTKHADSKNMHDVWLMQEHILHIIQLYNNSVEFSSKILGLYVQLQSKLYNNVLIECIINKLLSSFNRKNYYFYISLVHRLLLINKNLGSVIIRCIKFVLKQIGNLDNESFYLFMELCLYMLSYFSYENKVLKSKENFFKRKYNDLNKILKVQKENLQKMGLEKGGETQQREESDQNKKKRKRDEGDPSGQLNEKPNEQPNEQQNENPNEQPNEQLNELPNEHPHSGDDHHGTATGTKRTPVILKKNESTLNAMKNMDCKMPFCIEGDVKYSSDEEEADRGNEDSDKAQKDERDEHDEEESDDEEDAPKNEQTDGNKHSFDAESFKEELENLDMGNNLKKFTNLMYSVKKKYFRKWTRNFYFKSCSLIYKNELENLIPKSVITYCNSFKCDVDREHETFHEYSIFNSILKYSIDEINNIEDQFYDMSREEDYNKDVEQKALDKFKDSINLFIQTFFNYLNEKTCLNKVPHYFDNVEKSIEQLDNLSSTNLDGTFFNSYIFPSDFTESAECWNSYSILILFFKALIFFDSSNVSSLKKTFKNHAVIFSNYKNSGVLTSEEKTLQFEIELLSIVYAYFNNSILLNTVVAILLENEIVQELSVMHFIFAKLEDSSLDEYYVLRLIYESIDNLIIRKECMDVEKSKLKRKQTKNENEMLIKELEDKKNELIQKVFLLTNKTIFMLSEKMIKLKNENNTCMSKELLKESLVFLRTYADYVDADQFLQMCQENSFASELTELATIFKYASLKKKNIEGN